MDSLLTSFGDITGSISIKTKPFDYNLNVEKEPGYTFSLEARSGMYDFELKEMDQKN